MSANIYWKPEVPKKGEPVSTYTSSVFIQQAKKVFGTFPLRLSQVDWPKVEALAALEDPKTQNKEHNTPWTDLLDALSKNESIEVWAEY